MRCALRPSGELESRGGRPVSVTVCGFDHPRCQGHRRSAGEAMQHRPSEPIGDQSLHFPRRRRRTAAATAAAGLVLMLVAGCTSSRSAASVSSAAAAASTVAGPPAGPAAPSSAAASAAAGAPSAGSAATGSGARNSSGALPNVGAQVVVSDRQVVKTANVTMNVVVTSTNQGAAADLTKEQTSGRRCLRPGHRARFGRGLRERRQRRRNHRVDHPARASGRILGCA